MCNGLFPPTSHGSEFPMQSNVEVVLGVFRAVEERDREALFALYHDDVEFHDAPSLPYGGTVRGEAAIRAQLEAAPEATWLGTWGPLQPTEAERKMDPRVIAAEGEEVTVLYTHRALRPDGERFEARCLASTRCATASSLGHRCSTTTRQRS